MMRMTWLPRFLLFFAAGAMAFSGGYAQQPAAPEAGPDAPAAGIVARVNGVAIPQEDLEVLLRERVEQGQADTPDLRKQLREELIAHEIVAQEAATKGIDKKPETAVRIKLGLQNILFDSYLRDFLATNPVSDETARKEYEQIVARQGNREYRVRHILVESEAVARYLIGQLRKNEVFSKLAGEVSADAASKGKGGELDWTAEGDFAKPFAETIGKLKKGQFTVEPVQSQYGWHIIKLEDERPLNHPPFEEVREKIKQRIQQRLFDEELAVLQINARIE